MRVLCPEREIHLDPAVEAASSSGRAPRAPTVAKHAGAGSSVSLCVAAADTVRFGRIPPIGLIVLMMRQLRHSLQRLAWPSLDGTSEHVQPGPTRRPPQRTLLHDLPVAIVSLEGESDVAAPVTHVLSWQ